MKAEGLKLLGACLDEADRLIGQYNQVAEDPGSKAEIENTIEAIRAHLSSPGRQSIKGLEAQQIPIWRVHQQSGGLSNQVSLFNRFTRAVWFMVEAAICLSSKRVPNGTYMAKKSQKELREVGLLIQTCGWVTL